MFLICKSCVVNVTCYWHSKLQLMNNFIKNSLNEIISLMESSKLVKFCHASLIKKLFADNFVN